MKTSKKRELPIIIAIIGPSGSGKTTMAKVMAENGIPTIVSYTTRPMREGETNGIEHWFVTPEEKPNESEMIAYTKFGNYEYWATISQINNICTYVIDEKGLFYLQEKFSDACVIFTVYIDRDIQSRTNAGVDKERCDRDADRIQIPLEQYDYVIHNTYSLEDFKDRIKQLTISLLK